LRRFQPLLIITNNQFFHSMRFLLVLCCCVAVFSAVFAQPNAKDQAYSEYVGNYVQNVLSEIKFCEQGICPHNLRKISFSLNQYDTCSLGNCAGNKEVQIWYKINPQAQPDEEKGEDWTVAINPVRILVIDKSQFWEGQQFIYEGKKLLYYSFENQLEAGEFAIRDTNIVARAEQLSTFGKEEKQKPLLNQYQLAQSQWKNGAIIQQQAARYIQKLLAICSLYLER
jgi:hypothetical protein